MNEQQPSMQPLTEQEAAIEKEICSGEVAREVAIIENYYAAHSTLFVRFEDILRGKTEPNEESIMELSILLKTASQAYATIFSDESVGFDDKVDNAASAMQQAVNELRLFLGSFGVSIQFKASKKEDHIKAYKDALDRDNPSKDHEILESYFGNFHSLYFASLANYVMGRPGSQQ